MKRFVTAAVLAAGLLINTGVTLAQSGSRAAMRGAQCCKRGEAARKCANKADCPNANCPNPNCPRKAQAKPKTQAEKPATK